MTIESDARDLAKRAEELRSRFAGNGSGIPTKDDLADVCELVGELATSLKGLAVATMPKHWRR